MKKLLSILVFSFLMVLSAQSQDFSLTGAQGYPISANQDACPQFMINIFGQGAKKITNVEFVVEYSSNVSLTYEMWETGARFKNGSDAVGHYGTNEDVLERLTNKHRTKVSFYLVNNEPAVDFSQKFKFIELYFRFTTKPHGFKNGDILRINLTNIKFTTSDGSTGNLSDQVVEIKFTDLSSVEEQMILDKIFLYPNPTQGDNLQLKVATDNLREVELTVINTAGAVLLGNRKEVVVGESLINLPIANLPNGAYYCLITIGYEKRIIPFTVQR